MIQEHPNSTPKRVPLIFIAAPGNKKPGVSFFRGTTQMFPGMIMPRIIFFLQKHEHLSLGASDQVWPLRRFLLL